MRSHYKELTVVGEAQGKQKTDSFYLQHKEEETSAIVDVCNF